MTSRFGKTYSRKGGEANSKFDEVFSNKKATLSTKWGETTYKAQLTSKRPLLKTEAPEPLKRPKLDEDDGSDDPFGFDSDDESKPVTSRGTPETSSGTEFPPGKKSEEATATLNASSVDSNSSPADSEASVQGRDSAEGQSLTGQGDVEAEEKPVDFDQLPLLKSASCRTYHRPSRQKDGEEGAGVKADKPSSTAPNPSSTPAAGSSEAKTSGRGRVRDYTVLHPSCVSVCNVTIQDSMERTVDEFASAPPADLGEAGTFKRKTDAPPPKPTRFRPTQTKTKKETKLEFFGFDEHEGLEADGEATASGSTSYKIKYFGFDELSESDSDEDENSPAAEKRKARKAASAAASVAAMSGSADSPQTSDSQDTVYNARHWNQPEPEEMPPPAPTRSISAPVKTNSHKDDGVFKAPPPPPKVMKSVTIPTQLNQDIVTTLKCRKEHKELYTVVQHVKHFNDVVEFGENQEFTDDFEYLETGLKSEQPLNTRCLSIISLATRCAMPSFRMHLRARGKVAQVFKMLSDSQQHPNLALCTAALMYILSRDRLNMDLDRACLELMIRLLELEQDHSVDDQLTAKEMSKVKEKIRKLCETVHNKHLDLENITTGHLAMETLLSLTSKRAGDWFKEELRLLGGLDHIVDKVKECVENLSEEEDKEKLVASLWGAERCLRVLESVTVHNPENQAYLIAYKESQLIVSSARGLQHCEQMIQRYSREVNSSSSAADSTLPHCSHSNVGKAVEDCMRAVIGVLLNLTHDNEWGSTKTGEQDKLMVTALNCVLRVPRYLPQEQRFDIRVLGLGLLINLVEYSARNRHCLENQKDNEAAKLFLEREQAAVLAEAQTDDIISEAPKPQLDQSGEWQETSGEIQWVASENNDADDKEKEKKEEEDEELDLNKALQHAGKHMEDSIVASYTALLLGCLCQGSPMNVTTVREHLPKGDFSIMTEMLKKFLNFMNLTCAVGTTGQKSISRVIDYLEHC
uniref:Wings apart-like protein homolog n=1 Tax=Denticeps clupeoides TaxID=299321 RepID=A0AAY4AVE4_9TELE